MNLRRLKALISPPLVVVAVLVFLVEEVLWDGLAWTTAALGRWAPVARVEASIRRLPPYLAILLFVVPWMIILPVKLAALWLLATGHAVSGVLLFAGGEVFGVGFLARIYVLCRPALATLSWFLRVEGWMKAASAWAHDHLNRIALWRRVRKKLHFAIGRCRDVSRQAVKVLRDSMNGWSSGSNGWLRARLRAAHRLVRAQFQR
ncbi:MAG TPA: hypothetical protein VN809_00360 [Telmatospirillum sp.]|nr:hypothetical protein [Telmatospirillum sp.]